MSWQDRDYARRPTAAGPASYVRTATFGGGRSIVTILIIINAAVFLLCSATSKGGNIVTSALFQWTAMHAQSVAHGQIWRLVTSDYLHFTFWHIFVNMLGLHFLGRPLERDWGPRRFFAFYTVAGVLGSLLYMLLTMINWLPANGIAAGASGCILGLLGACAVRYPHAQVYVYMLFPMKIRTVALIFGAWYVLNVLQRGPNAGGDACHLAGLLFGVWWEFKGHRWWAAWRAGINASNVQPKRVRQRGFKAKVEQRRADEATIDAILKKVYEGGIHSLTDAEKRSLEEATARQQQREREAGRVDRL